MLSAAKHLVMANCETLRCAQGDGGSRVKYCQATFEKPCSPSQNKKNQVRGLMATSFCAPRSREICRNPAFPLCGHRLTCRRSLPQQPDHAAPRHCKGHKQSNAGQEHAAKELDVELSEFGYRYESKRQHPTRNVNRNPPSCMRTRPRNTNDWQTPRKTPKLSIRITPTSQGGVS